MQIRVGAAVFLLLLFAVVFAAFADERSPSEKLKRATVRLREYKFEPSEITLKVGEEAELTLINEGNVLHEFITAALQDLTVDVEVNGVVAETLGLAELEIPPKMKVTLRFTPEKTGEFQIACHANVPKDHFKEGMVGKLVIRK